MNAILIDTNLLLLLVVGTADLSYVAAHKRLKVFTKDDFTPLDGLIGKDSTVVVLPHILTEVSNLASQTYTDAKRDILAVLRELVRGSEEWQVRSLDAVEHRSFLDLGLTDAAILLAAERDRTVTIPTADLDLAIEAEMAGLSVINFNHRRA